MTAMVLHVISHPGVDVGVLLPVVVLRQELGILDPRLGIVLPFVNGTAPLSILLPPTPSASCLRHCGSPRAATAPADPSTYTLPVVPLGHGVRPHDRNQGDLRDRDVVVTALAGVDAVVHAAAIPEPVSHLSHETFGNNVESTFHVLNLAGKAGIRRVVNISSASAFGFAWSARGVAPAEVPVTDGHPYVGDDVYGLSKQVGELTAATASRAWDMTVVSLRFPFIGAGSPVGAAPRPDPRRPVGRP